MRQYGLLLSLILFNMYSFAQKENLSYKFYGFVRGDLFYNTRANMAPVDGNFYLFPLDKLPDANGKDINATPNGSFYSFTTRLGLDMTGPMIGNVRSSAKIETDFGGFSGSTTMIRIRQAYVALDWTHSQVLIGQTWHPLFGSVMPEILNLCTGAPFQPFNRSPQIRYQYKKDKLRLSAAALWQLQYLSSGPKGMSEDYIKNGGIPELTAGVDFTPGKQWLVGAGVHFISLKPRTSSTLNDKTYKVNERMSTYSYEAHGRYSDGKLSVAAKTIIASSLDHTAMIGGYGVSLVNETTGEQEYTPFRHSTSWLNITYGKKWKPGLFVGYTKNLGTDDPLTSEVNVYGLGLTIDQLFTVKTALSYNLPNWQIGFEYCPATAWYGTICHQSGKVVNSHAVTNHRFVGVMMYYF